MKSSPVPSPGRAFSLIAAFPAILLLGVGGAFAQPPEAAPPGAEPPPPASGERFAPDAAVPVDESIRYGTLDNGLRYWIRRNGRPENRAELRLVVNAGSILEDEKQLGLAHFVEHMAFNGTRKFEKQELVEYLESIGLRFGPDLNAYTSFDETVYMLQVPTDDEEIVGTAFEILEQWAHAVSFEGEEIDKERGVVLGEWRSGLGAGARLRDAQFPVLLKDSLYAERLPIGRQEILESFAHEDLVRFYRDWYRPDLMAVIAVGDFDVDRIEMLTKRHFGALENPEEPRERFSAQVPDHDETLVSITEDPEIAQTSVAIVWKRPVESQDTVGDYRRSRVESLFYGMLNNRLSERASEPNPPYLVASAGRGSMGRTKSANILTVGVVDGDLDRGLAASLTEAERVQRHGFTSSEMERQKADILRSYEGAYAERDTSSSSLYAAEYIRAFLEGEPTPGIAYELDLVRAIVPGILLDEVNDLARRFLADENRVILVAAPESDGAPVADRDSLLAAFREVESRDIPPYVDEVAEGPLLASRPEPGRIIDRVTVPELGYEEWELSNGVRVVLKPTDFKNDQVQFTSFSPGGHSLVEDADHVAALTATAVVGQGGLGRFDLNGLRKALAGKVAQAVPAIAELFESISGGSSPEDLETLFQLIHLHLTEPRRDVEAYESYRVRLEGVLANRDARPETLFQDRLTEIMAQGHHRRRPFTVDMLDELDLDRSLEIYRDRFRDIGDFTFFFVGSFDLDEIEGLVTEYLASLPSTGRDETWRDVAVGRPEGVVEETLLRGIEDKARVQLVFGGDFDWSAKNRYELHSMVDTLRIRLRETLREDMGGTYGVSASPLMIHYPKPEYRILIGFECAPDAVEELTEAVFGEIEKLKRTAAEPDLIAKVTEAQLRERETQLRSNEFWLGSLMFYYYHREDPAGILQFEELRSSLDAETVRGAARRYIDEESYVKVVLLPGAEVEAPEASERGGV